MTLVLKLSLWMKTSKAIASNVSLLNNRFVFFNRSRSATLYFKSILQLIKGSVGGDEEAVHTKIGSDFHTRLAGGRCSEFSETATGNVVSATVTVRRETGLNSSSS